MMLTPRQMEVAELVAQGLSNKGIARRTGLAVRTVKEHVSEAARRIPGKGRARWKLTVFVLSTNEGEAE